MSPIATAYTFLFAFDTCQILNALCRCADDRFFFDPALGNGTGGAGYTVDKWLADLNTRYGGIDKALIWPTYTNIGIDDRNTFDLIRSLPGGVEGIKVVVQQLHARGVKVLWPYHPWDHSTRGQQRNNETDPQAMAELQRDTGADGFNGDTMVRCPPQPQRMQAGLALRAPVLKGCAPCVI